MEPAVNNLVFSVPLRHLSNPVFTNDQVLTESTVRGISRFVGDVENDLLRYLAVDCPFLDSDWPLLLFGPTGTGKTSLALSVVAKIADQSESIQIANFPTSKPAIFTSPDFVRRFNSAIETNSVSDFRNRIIGSSVLFLDNIHLLTAHPHVQDELVYVLDQRSENDAPVVLTSRLPAQGLTGLAVHLNSRLVNGLSIPIQAPGPAARRVLIAELMKIHGLDIDEQAVDWLVVRLQLTVPKLNQFFSQLNLSLKNCSPNPALDIDFFKNLFERSSNTSVFDNSRRVISAVADTFHLQPNDLKGSSRKQSIVQARGVAIYLCRELLNASFSKIGSWFGNRDHSTILHAYRKTKSKIESETDTVVKNSVMLLNNQLLDHFSGQVNLSLLKPENLSVKS